MPEFLKNRLKAEAASRGFTGRRADRYVYGAMNNMGAMRGNQVTAKGERMQAKHERDTKAGPRTSVAVAVRERNHPHKNLGKYLHRSKKSPY